MNAFEILERLIAFPTVSRDGNRDLANWVADLLRGHGIGSELYPSAEGDRASLFATVGASREGGILLSGHTDVVPVEGQVWTSDPFRLRETDGLLFGRGAADMKGFVACAIEALIRIGTRTPDRAVPVHLALSYDEEIGCVGVRPMLSELVNRGLCPDWVMVGEPTSMRIATGHKGKVAARAVCRGTAAHSALAPTALNAIHVAADFLLDLRNLQETQITSGARDNAYDIPFSTLHAGIIKGGTALNMVPETCILDFEIRNVAADDPGHLLDVLFKAAAARESALRPRFPQAEIRIDVVNDYPGLETPPDVSEIARLKSLSQDPEPVKVAFGSEGGLFRNAFDVPVVVCGPGSMDQGHKPDEFIARSQMETCREMLGNLLR